MKRAFVARAIVVASLPLTYGPAASGEQYYVLQGIDKSQSDETLTTPGVDGFTIRVSWKELYENGFSWLDNQIARGDRLGIDIQLRVMAGANAPANLPGVTYFQYLTDQSGVSELRSVPVPWDISMHSHWQTLAAQLAARYGNNSRIKVVHVPSFASTSEMHMPEEVKSVPGYSSRVLAESWAAMASPLASGFPGAIVSLNYVTPTQSQLTSADSNWLLNEIARLAGNRAGYQANDFDAEVDLQRNKYQTLLDQKQFGRHVGFQMVSSSESSRFGGDFLEAVATATAAGGEWLEIYAADIGRIPPAGDYNLNGTVDAADYVIWRKALGSTINLAADGDGSKTVDITDYQLWRRQFRTRQQALQAAASSLSDSHSASTPEPSAWTITCIALLPLVYWRRARQSLRPIKQSCHRSASG